MKSTKSRSKPSGTRRSKDLPPKKTSDVKGGSKRADGAGGGNVTAGWSLVNKTSA